MVTAPGAVARAQELGHTDVLVVIVTFNSRQLVARCLEGLVEALDAVDSARVVVVDNASVDGTSEEVARVAPWAELVEPGSNLGYAAAINAGLRGRPAQRCVVVLNPDAVPTRGCIRYLLDALALPGVGIAVPRVVDSAGRLKYSLRREPTLLRAVGEAVLGGHRAARFPALGDMIRDEAHYRDGATADWATGAAMALSSDLVARLGPWSEDFFLYSEETDYALRAHDAGYVLRWVQAAVVEHPGGEMSRSPFLWSLVAVNRVRLYRRRHSAAAAAAYWVVVVLNEATRAALGRPVHRAALRALLTGGPRVPAQTTAAEALARRA